MSEESRTVLEFPLVDSLEDTDVVYLIRGTGVTRDKRILGSSIRTAFKRSDLINVALAADTTVDLTLITTRNALVGFSGTVVADYTVTLMGVVPVVGQTTLIHNGSAGTITLAGAFFAPSIPTILPGEACLLDWTSGSLALATIGYSGPGFVKRLVKSVMDASAYPSAVGSSSLPGDILIIRNGALERVSAASLHGQTYAMPLSGLYAPHILDSTGDGSSVELSTNFGYITSTEMRGISGRFRWRITLWGSLDNASVVSSSRFVTLTLAAPSPVVTDGDHVAADVLGSLVSGRRHWPVSVTISADVHGGQGLGSLNAFQVISGYTFGVGAATDELQIRLLNPDGTRMTYAQLKTLIGPSRVGFFVVAEGDS